MKKLLKGVLFVLVALVLLLVVALAAHPLWMGAAVRTVVGMFAPKYSGTPVVLTDCSVNLYDGHFELSGFDLSNPEGCSEKSAVRLGSLKADFFRDVLRVEKVRRNFDITEVKLYREVLQEGVDKGVFDIDSVYLTADLLHYCLKGIEVPYIRGKIAPSLTGEIRTEYVTKLVLGAFHRKK